MEKRGLHSGKEGTIPKLVNGSEVHFYEFREAARWLIERLQNVARATQFLSGFKRQKRVPAIVDYVAAGSRFK
jgi:staphylococcal nuclease domain-containing protein 1